MPKLFKKFLLSSLAALVILFSFSPFFVAKAATGDPLPPPTWYNPSFGQWWTKVYDDKNPSEIFGERYTAAQVQWVIYGLFSFILNSATNTSTLSCLLGSGADLSKCKSAIEDLLKITDSSSQQESASLASLVFATDRPFSGIAYVKDRAENFSLVPTVHAQSLGFGYTALQFVQEMWRNFRDIAYGMFVLVAVVFAFMIMFRVKLSPQTVVSVQSALPKIIGSLIAVTFSYAIAGLLIDLMYVVIGFVSLIMAPMIPKVPLLLQTKVYTPSDVFNLLTLGPTSEVAGGAVGSSGVFGLLAMYFGPLLLLLIVLMLIGFILSAPAAGVLGWIALILLGIVILIIVWNAVKIVFALFKAFANILLLTIFAPLQLVFGALIPSLGFGEWVKSYFANLSVFVVTGVLFLLAWIFSLQAWVVAFGSGGTGLTLSESANSPWPPLLGSGGKGSTGLLFIGVSFVLFTLIPKATEVVQGFISGKPFAYGTAIGEAFGPLAPVGGYAKSAALGAGGDWAANQLVDYRNRRGPGQTKRDQIIESILASVEANLRPRSH